MKKEKKRGSLIRQVTVLFLISTLLTGFLTFISQRVIADENVTEQMETLTAQIAEETAASIKEYPSYAWLIRYWHDHWDELDIEYDVTPDTAKETKEKCRLLSSRYPGIQPRYSSR